MIVDEVTENDWLRPVKVKHEILVEYQFWN
jgi:hypothetical protein